MTKFEEIGCAMQRDAETPLCSGNSPRLRQMRCCRNALSGNGLLQASKSNPCGNS